MNGVEESAASSEHLPESAARWLVGRMLSIALFFVSGAAALIYEISWTRQIGLVLGQTADAAAMLLAIYMGGLALGYWLGERYRLRTSALRGYAVSEFAVAAWACAVPMLLGLAQSSSVAPRLVNSQPLVQAVARMAFCFAALLPATTALGATLPFMTTVVSRGRERSGTLVFIAYASNTAGALAGVLLATFWMLEKFGVRTSSLIAAAASAACGLLALLLDGTRRRQDALVHLLPHPSDMAASQPVMYGAIAAVSGFATLALEVLFTRLFSLVFHNSTYTFGVVVAAFLLALATASALFAGLSRWFSARAILGFSGFGGALAIIGSVWLFIRLTRFEYFESGSTFESYAVGAFGFALLIVAPPVLFLGMILPGTWKAVSANATGIGRLAAVNTLAGAAGAILAALGLRTTFGLWGSFWLIAALVASLPLIVVRYRVLYGVVAAAILIPLALSTSNAAERALSGGLDAGKEIVRRWESSYGWIDVVHDVRNERWQVRQNLHYSHGSSGSSATRERRQGHLPLLLHPHPHRVAFLGLGTGITASCIRFHPNVQETTLVELIPEVVEAARVIGEFNERIVDSPEVLVRIDDARHFLAGTRDQFDVIVSDLYVPWESQTGYLYTREHFKLVRERLREGGLFCQWIPLYQVGPDEFALIADTFCASFPQTSLWWGQIDSRRPIIALVGSESPLRASTSEIASRLSLVEPLTKGSDSYLAKPELIADLCAGAWPERLGSLLNTDENPRVEFRAPVTQSRSAMLSRRTLHGWFDTVLSQIPDVNLDGVPADKLTAQTRRRREWARFLLFGSTE